MYYLIIFTTYEVDTDRISTAKTESQKPGK